MPTMTRMHRHSSSSASVVEESRGRRRPVAGLPGDANKENFGVHFMSSPFGNASLIALQDLSNVHGSKSPQRRSFSEGSGPRQATPQLAALRCLPQRSTALEDSQLSSSRMGDTTLDRMLDAIIESARKEVRCKVAPPPPTSTSTSTGTLLADNGGGEWSETSVHEMEVRTPTHLKRQRVVRRKNPHKTTAPKLEKEKQKQLEFEQQLEQQLEHVPSTKRCLSFSSSDEEAEAAAAEEDDEEDVVEQQVAKRSSLSARSSSSRGSASSTSSSSSSTRGADTSQRGSIDLSIVYDAREQQLNVHVIRCRDLQRSHGSGCINAYVKVSLSGHGQGQGHGHGHSSSSGGSMSSGYQRTAVHRHSGRPFFDQRFSFPVSGPADGEHLQLAVWHRDRQLKRSEFLGCSTFPLSELVHPEAATTAGSYKLLSQPCPPNNNNNNNINNNNRQSQTKATGQQVTVQQEQEQEQKESQEMAAAATVTVTPQKTANGSGVGVGATTTTTTTSLPLNDEVISISIDSMGREDPLMPQQPQQPMRLSKKALHQRDADENLFLRFLELDPPADGNANSTTNTGSGTGTGTGGGTGASASAGQSSAAKANESNANHLNGSSSSGRRQSTMPGAGAGAGAGGSGGSYRQSGRTPFTMTKRLTRTEERGFGFSIVWTHPPRVEKVEAGLSADRCGILPGDYVIFVDKHNVVTMPEADVLNLIRSQGSALTLEIFRRSGAGATTIISNLGGSNANVSSSTATSITRHHMPGGSLNVGIGLGLGSEEHTTATTATGTGTAMMSLHRTASSRIQGSNAQMGNSLSRPATACSGTTSSIEAAKRRLHLPQVTFSKESIVPITDNRRRFLLQLISREQNFTAALHFGVQRFVQPLLERKDLISPNDHRTLFQNIDELLRIAEDILEQLCSSQDQQQQQHQQQADQEPHMNFASRVYLSKTTAICAAYKKYCNGIKRADCVLVNKSRQTGSEFIAFITEPAVPRKRPDLTMFIHRPLQHFREILKLMQLLAGNCHVDTEEHKNFSTVIAELQAAYREITVSSGLMEPLGEGRPLLTLQDLESRMVFTKCKPFTLAVQGRQWIFGGDLSRVEGRSVKPYWTLLFSDIIVFAKVSRDRVLFITEEPIPIANVVDSCFHMRKKTTEFRLTVDPNGRLAESPTGYCAPDLTRTPKRGARRKSLILRAPSLELKAVWQNLLQRQIFLVNAALGSTPLSSPLDSPDVLNTLVPLSDIGLTSASMGSMKLPSLDSIHLKQQQKQQQRSLNSSHGVLGGATTDRSSHGHSHSNSAGGTGGGHVEQIELLIDEKCRILNKTGTPKSSALHLANWMKGQLDKQQQQARLAAIARSQENVSAEDEQLIFNSDSEQDERITYWTRQQLEKRTKELNLAKENGGLSAKPNFGGKRLSGVEELSMSATSDIYSTSDAEAVTSVISQSHSTTSDSQITVRSSPIVLDKLAVCRHCHKNCQQSGGPGGSNRSGAAGTAAGAGAGPTSGSSSNPVLLCNSLKVQHSQSSPNRCCKLNGISSELEMSLGMGRRTGRTETNTADTRAGAGGGGGSVTSMSSSTTTTTITGELSSKRVASSSTRRETGDTESDVAQLITDELSLSQSEATDDSVGAMPNSSSLSAGEGTAISSKLRHLDQSAAPAPASASGPSASASLPNGHCSKSNSNSVSGSPKPLPPPRRTRIVAQLCQEPSRPKANQQVKAIVTITETARIMRSVERSPAKSVGGGGAGGSGSPAKYAACHCRCQPEDFTHAQLSPDKMEQQTCKLLESPKQTTSTSTIEQQQQKQEDDQLSLMLIGLAQFAPAARLCGGGGGGGAQQGHKLNQREDDSATPTIAVVPPTPDAVLTKTSTHVWDNSGCSSSNGGGGGGGGNSTTTTTTSTATTTAKQPRQATIENIPEDSCDESPLDEEPPYRPMSSALRRFGTMSSLEKLPSDDRMDEADELDDDLEEPASYTPNGHDDEDAGDDDDDGDDEEVGSDKALAQNLNEPSTSSGGIHLANGDVLASGAWTNRAGAYVSDKMSFFEESRAFIDKYLGRWNAGDGQQQQGGGGAGGGGGGTASETDEQMDECTSGATSGEEVWGTPTSGGDNDDQDLQLINSENTHSSPTKSSTSLNDDDDTELMMDELLMAPPMTASTIRGLLPRRRLEPLFEEETESDEEKTQQDSDNVKKGEATTNGHYLEDSAGSSDDSEAAAVPPPQPPVPPAVVPDREEDPAELDQDQKRDQEQDQEQEVKQQSSDSKQVVQAKKEEQKQKLVEREREREEHLHSNVMMGPRPLVTTRLLPTTAIVSEVAPLVASSCEYLLDQRPSSESRGSPGRDRVAGSSTMSTMTPLSPTRVMPVAMTIGSGTGIEKGTTSRTTTTATMTAMTTTTTRMTMTTTTTTSMTMASRAPSSIITTTSSGSVTTNSGGRASGKPPRFVPPPPPPRRLLLTQTDLSAAPAKTEPLRRKSGATADSGSSAAVGVAASASVPIGIGSRITPASAPNTTSSKRAPSSTIIETCLLGAPRPVSVTSLATVSRMAKPIPTVESQRERRSREEGDQQEQEREREREREQEPSHSPAAVEQDATGPRSVAAAQAPHAGCGLSPRLEMRLALNHDILGDEDLICYEPGPDLTTILGHDLSTFHRLTGRDLLSRSATNRVQPKEAVISYSQHRNSKMDTPTVNRRPRPLSAGAALSHSHSHSRSRSHSNTTNSSSHGSPLAAGGSIRAGAGEDQAQQQRHPHPQGHPAGWSGGGSVARAGVNGSGSVGDGSTGSKSNRDGSKLGDLEILARREKIYSMSQSRSGCRVRETSTMSTTLVAMASEMRTEMEMEAMAMATPMADSTRRDSSWPTRAAAAAASLTRTRSTTSMDGAGAITTTTTMTEAFLETDIGRSKRLINFIKRRNSEIIASSTTSSSTPNFSDGAVQLGEQQPHPSHSQSSLLLQKLPSSSSVQDSAVDMAQMSPRKDNDKPSLNRRLWKQITKRRRTNSVSQIVAG